MKLSSINGIMYVFIVGSFISYFIVIPRLISGDRGKLGEYWESVQTPSCEISDFVPKGNDGLLGNLNARGFKDPFCLQSDGDRNTSICYLGKYLCKPGYGGRSCRSRLDNPYYAKLCPNLGSKHTGIPTDTLDITVPLSLVGGEYDPRYDPASSPKFCAYLCYSHSYYGVAVVPTALWLRAQKAEADLWQQVGRSSWQSNANDRSHEHMESFNRFKYLPDNFILGKVIEVGAGPWTQLKAVLHVRPDLIVHEFTVWEPGANRYMAEVASCSYRSGTKLVKWSSKPFQEEYHEFPVRVISEGGELLLSPLAHDNKHARPIKTLRTAHSKHNDRNSSEAVGEGQFDTLISINVIEHVQDAFKYLTGLYRALRTGGYLIFHERYYDDRGIFDGDQYHPIRIKRSVLDIFLEGFQVLFNNCNATYGGRPGETGYYVIARKLSLYF